MQPCSIPMKLSNQEVPRAAISRQPSEAATARLVAPEKPSTGVQTVSPDICAG
jgi:hypothetical protein